MDDGSLQHLSPLIRISNTGYLLAINELSFGALRKAQHTLDRTHTDSDDGEESDEYSTEGQRLDDDSDEQSKAKVGSAAKGSKRGAATAARKNKHA
jgi:hypothetical protein